MNLVRSYNRCACLLTALGITSYITATFYTFQPSLLIALCGLPAVVAAWWYTSTHRFLLPRWAVNGLLLLAVVYAALRASQGVSVEVIAELVVFIQLIKLGDRRSPRDDAQVLALAIFMAIAAMLTSNQLWVGVQLVAFIPLLIATVMLYQLYSGWFASGQSAAAGSPTFVGRTPLRATVAFATMGTLALSLFVFIIMPRGVGENVLGNWRGPQAGTRTGFTDKVKLGSGSIISSSPTIVLDMLVRDASLNEDEPGANIGGADQVYYLRGAVLDDYDPRTGLWSSGPHRRQTYDPRLLLEGALPLPGGIRASVQQDITIYGIDGSKAVLFCLWHPTRLQVGRTSTELEVDLDAVTVRRSGQSGTLAYSVWSGLNEPLGETPSERVPASSTSAPVHDLAAQVLTQAGVDPDPAVRSLEDDARAARAIQDYLQRNFAYSLIEQATPSGQDPIEHFLLTTREGHCEYFAAAMTLMCRSVGINTRMVAGYVAAEFNPTTGRYVVRESNAHAWVEVEAAGHWRRFDPTPPADLARLHKPAEGLMASLRRAMESVEYAWNTGVVGFDEGTRQRLFGPRDGRRAGVLGFIENTSRRMQNAGVQVVLNAMMMGLMVFLGVAGLGLLFSWIAGQLAPLIRSRVRGAIPVQAHLSAERRSQVRFYARLLDALRARGVPKPKWLPPLAHAAAIRAVHAQTSDAAARLSALYYAATFGDRALSGAELAEAESLLAKLADRNA